MRRQRRDCVAGEGTGCGARGTGRCVAALHLSAAGVRHRVSRASHLRDHRLSDHPQGAHARRRCVPDAAVRGAENVRRGCGRTVELLVADAGPSPITLQPPAARGEGTGATRGEGTGTSGLGSPVETSHSWCAARVTPMCSRWRAQWSSRVAGLVDVDHHDVVELEALDLRDVGDVDAGLEVELVAADAAQRGDLGAAQALEVRRPARGGADHGARSRSARAPSGCAARRRGTRPPRRRREAEPRRARRGAGPRAGRDRRAGPSRRARAP